jgi:predicted alpha-1,2-mannosidase
MEKADIVDPMIGTDGTGHTFPGATVPFGMVQLSPSNDFKGWAWCSWYHYQDSVLKGFAHTHISGAGLTGLGDILFMPTTGKPQLLPGSEARPETGYRSRFSHEREHASAGYYEVRLDDYDIRVELTAVQRSGFHRYTFDKEGKGNVIIDPVHSVGESVLDAKVEFLSDTELQGFKKSTGDAGTPRTVYFYARFSKPFTAKGVYKKGEILQDIQTIQGNDIRAYVSFNVEAGEKIEAGVALSFVDMEGAKANFDAETRHFTFDQAWNNARHQWEDKLSKFEVESMTDEDQRIFYTAVYHSFISPNLISDVNGNYIIEQELYRNDTAHYSTFSTWDTYRALHPLFTIVEHENNAKFINSLAARHHIQNIGLPLWEFLGHDNKCMIGYNTVSPMVEAVLKGTEGVDPEMVYEAVTAAANNTDPAKSSVVYGMNGMKGYVKYHFVPAEYNSSVAKTTEQNYFDWCIAQLAKKLNKEEDYEYYMARSLGYRNLFNPDKKLFWPKYSNGSWRHMDTTSWHDFEMNYVSGNVWGYPSYVPHDVEGLIELIGGREAFDRWLDKIYSDTTNLSGDQHVDISGFIGKYGHGDEPSHHMAYLFNYAGKPRKTQEMVRRVMDEFYSDEPDGLVNNEDLGQMSAWYIFSAIGFYPVSPCGGYYDIGSPKVKKATINLENGKNFTVRANNNSKKNIYIQSATLNGEPFNRNYITHKEIMEGGTLELSMGKKPNLQRGTSANDVPLSEVKLPNTGKLAKTLPAPFVSNKKFVFEEPVSVSLQCAYPEASIHYTLDGSQPGKNSSRYQSPIPLTANTTIKAIAMADGFDPSVVMKQEYLKGMNLLDEQKKVRIQSLNPPDVRGDLSGKNHFDGIFSTTYHTDKQWSVWREGNAEFIVNFDKEEVISKIIVSYLDHTGMNLFPPSAIRLSYNNGNGKYISLAKQTDIPVKETLNPNIRRLALNFNPIKTKEIKIVVESFGEMPSWYKGSGQPANLHLGEIVID